MAILADNHRAGLFRRVLARMVVHHDRAAVSGERDRHRPADPARGTGDESEGLIHVHRSLPDQPGDQPKTAHSHERHQRKNE